MVFILITFSVLWFIIVMIVIVIVIMIVIVIITMIVIVIVIMIAIVISIMIVIVIIIMIVIVIAFAIFFFLNHVHYFNHIHTCLILNYNGLFYMYILWNSLLLPYVAQCIYLFMVSLLNIQTEKSGIKILLSIY